jgi:FemAB-related protein (PEP-CTERM system-associated)
MTALTADRTANAIKPSPTTPHGLVHVAEHGDDASWDRFVAGHPQSSAYLYAGWPRLIGRAFGHEVRMLAAERGGAIAGVLPLVIMRSRLFGRFAISLPFLNAGGLLADDGAASDALVNAAVRVAQDAHADYLELRHTSRLCPSLLERRHRVAMTLGLQDTVHHQWEALDRKVRNQVRKAEKGSLTAVTGGVDLLGGFYDVFSRNMRDLGTPVFPFALFREAVTAYPELTTVTCVYKGEQPIAGAIVHRRGDWAEVIWASALREFNSLCANVFLYWQLIRSAVGHGCRTLEFGRCAPGEGTFNFKRQWGAEPQALVWEYWTKSGAIDFDASPRNPKYGRAVAVWRHLPLSLTTTIGPRIVRGIPC